MVWVSNREYVLLSKLVFKLQCTLFSLSQGWQQLIKEHIVFIPLKLYYINMPLHRDKGHSKAYGM